MVKVAGTEAKEAYGVLQATTPYKHAGKSGYIGVKISGKWFNLWGSVKSISKMVQPLEIGDQVHFRYSVSNKGFYRLHYIEKVTEKDLAKLGNEAQELKGIEEVEQHPTSITIYAYFEKLTKAINELTETLKEINKLNGGEK